MPETDQWLERFEVSHRNIAHAPVYWLAVPVLILGTVGLLWSLPVPNEFREISPVLNWGSAFLLSAVVYYFIISLPLAFGVLPFVLAVAAFELWLQFSAFSALHASLGLIVGGLLGIAMGRAGQGGARAVWNDVQHIMITPVWLLSLLYRKLGIPH